MCESEDEGEEEDQQAKGAHFDLGTWGGGRRGGREGGREGEREGESRVRCTV